MVVMIDTNFDTFETTFDTNHETDMLLKKGHGEYVLAKLSRLSFGVLHRRCDAPAINLSKYLN